MRNGALAKRSRIRAQEHILDIKSTFYDMHPCLDAKRGIMQTRVLEKMRAEGSKTPFNLETERTVFGER